MTAPVRDVEVVLGKFFGAQGFYVLIWLGLLPLLGILGILGEPDWGPVLTVYAGLFALGLTTNALGVLASTGTRNQLVSAVIALTGNLLLMLVPTVLGLFRHDPEVERLVRYLSFTSHFQSDFVRGVFDLRYLVFYLSLACVFLFFSVRMLEARKWR